MEKIKSGKKQKNDLSKMKIVFIAVLTIGLLMFTVAKQVRADDDINERDSNDDDSYEHKWDFSHDFKEVDLEDQEDSEDDNLNESDINESEESEDQSDNELNSTEDDENIYIYETSIDIISDDSLDNDEDSVDKDLDDINESDGVNETESYADDEESTLSSEEEAILRMTVPETRIADYEDSDNDGVINKNDLYPGENDKNYSDSDEDGIVDAEDKFPGKNDLDFEDSDNDGVIDSQDSNIGKNTDKDHDGIDDTYDTVDNRSFFAKFAAFFGID